MPLPEGHRFPIAKYAAVRDGIVARGLLPTGSLEEPERCERTALGLVHTAGYLDAVLDGTLQPAEIRRLGFPWSPALRERSLRTAQGTVEAARDALDEGLGINLAGGTHHAFADRGEGFCVFNDAAVAARVMLAERLARRVLIVDLDVHQGDGTAAILADEPAVHTLSMHARNNFPFRKEASRLDVELDDRTGDCAYLATLRVVLPLALATSKPDLAIYLAGADPYEHDRLGRLALTKRGLGVRDAYVLDTLQQADIPVAIAMAGGYAERIDDIVDIHFATVAVALERHSPTERAPPLKNAVLD